MKAARGMPGSPRVGERSIPNRHSSERQSSHHVSPRRGSFGRLDFRPGPGILVEGTFEMLGGEPARGRGSEQDGITSIQSDLRRTSRQVALGKCSVKE